MRTLTFRVPSTFRWAAPPTPAVAAVPEWWKAMSKHADADGPGWPMGTAKSCAPLFEAMRAGYVLRLPVAVRAFAEGESVQFAWNPEVKGPGWGWQPVGAHFPEQTRGTPFGATVFRWQMPWSVLMPDGWAVLYTHPLNRLDLPFQTLSGIVEGDYGSPVNLPFVWTGGDGDHMLDAGLPVAQLLPMRLAEWTHEVDEVSVEESTRHGLLSAAHVDGYRRLFRRRRVYR